MGEVAGNKRKITAAANVLRRAGWVVIEPKLRRPTKLLDQCEFPDLRGDPGDTCTNSAAEKRQTRWGFLWLCPDHMDRPAKELFERRRVHD